MSDLDLDDLIEEADGDSSVIKQLRSKVRELSSTAKERETELEELRTFKAAQVAAQKSEAIGNAFKEAGLSEKQVALYERVNPDVDPATITKDAVLAFAAEYDLQLASGEQAEAPAPKEEGFTPVTTGTPPAEGKLSLADAQKLIREGKYDEAQKLYEQGRVETLQRDENGIPVVDWLATE
jgi:tetratricopeptide (TPR) repeat protein